MLYICQRKTIKTNYYEYINRIQNIKNSDFKANYYRKKEIIMSEKVALNKIINNEYLDSSTIYNLETDGLIVKITFTQYVITEKGLKLINEL